MSLQTRNLSSQPENACQNFPLNKDQFDPNASVWDPVICGSLTKFTPEHLSSSECLADKSIFVFGDSRGEQLTGELLPLMRRDLKPVSSLNDMM